MAAAISNYFTTACNEGEKVWNAVTCKPKDFFKGVIYSTSIMQLSSEILSTDPTIRTIKHAFSIAKTSFVFIDCTEEVAALPGKVYSVLSSANFNDVWDNFVQLILGVFDTLTTSYDFHDWCNYTEVCESIMPFELSVAISGALALSSFKRSIDTLLKFDNTTRSNGNPTPFEKHVRKLNTSDNLSAEELLSGEIEDGAAYMCLVTGLIKNICFVAMGTLLLLSTFNVYSAGTPIMLGIKSIALIAGYIKNYNAHNITPNDQLANNGRLQDSGGHTRNQFIPQLV